MIKNNEVKSICAVCKGMCCKRHAGIAIPEDFKKPITVEFLVDLLSTKKWTIDWWDGDPRNHDEIEDDDDYMYQAYYVRPAHTNETKVFTASWGGTCVFWSYDKGCSFSFEDRPFQCRGLVPKKGVSENCIITPGSSKRDIVIAWIPYQDIIVEAGRLVESQTEKVR